MSDLPTGDSERALFWDTPRRMARAQSIAARVDEAVWRKAGGRALDFGCGTGLISFSLSTPFSQITLMDIAPEMLRALEDKITAAGTPHMRPVLFDLTRAEWPSPGTFDAAYTSMALHHVRDVALVFRRLHAALADDGVLCAVDLDPVSPMFHADEPDFDGHHGFDHGTLAAWLRDAGFGGVRVETFYRAERAVNGTAVPYSLFCAVGTKG